MQSLATFFIKGVQIKMKQRGIHNYAQLVNQMKSRGFAISSGTFSKINKNKNQKTTLKTDTIDKVALFFNCPPTELLSPFLSEHSIEESEWIDALKSARIFITNQNTINPTEEQIYEVAIIFYQHNSVNEHSLRLRKLLDWSVLKS